MNKVLSEISLKLAIMLYHQISTIT